MGEEFPEAAKGVPGVWTHMSTFLSGPRSCMSVPLSSRHAVRDKLTRPFLSSIQWLPLCSRRVRPPLLLSAQTTPPADRTSSFRVKAIMFVLLRSFVFTHLAERPNFIKKLALCVCLRPCAPAQRERSANLLFLGAASSSGRGSRARRTSALSCRCSSSLTDRESGRLCLVVEESVWCRRALCVPAEKGGPNRVSRQAGPVVYLKFVRFLVSSCPVPCCPLCRKRVSA